METKKAPAKKKATTKRAVTKRKTKDSNSSEELFDDYISKMKKAKASSEELIAPYAKEDKSSIVINLIWDAIFDYFCRSDKEEISPTNLNTLAGVVQKLLASSKDSQPKERDSGSISPQALAEIEDKLNLL